MTTTDSMPWEPPLAGTEVEHLVAALDRQRATFRWKAGGLDGAGLRTRVGASTLTLGSLLKHLAFVEDYYFSTKLRGGSPGAPWEAVDWDASPDWPFTSAAGDTPTSSTRSGTAPSSGDARGSARPWPTAGSTRPSTTATTTVVTRACAACSSTWSRSTAGTRGTRTCSARPWTAWSGRTRPPGGARERG